MIVLSRLLRRSHNAPELRSDLRIPPRMINEVLAMLLAAEAGVLCYASLPWGVSLVGAADRIWRAPGAVIQGMLSRIRHRRRHR